MAWSQERTAGMFAPQRRCLSDTCFLALFPRTLGVSTLVIPRDPEIPNPAFWFLQPGLQSMRPWVHLAFFSAAIPQVRQAALVVLFGAWQLTDKRGEFYNLLWMLVFGFATLNILALVTRSLEPSGRRRRMAVGEMLAVLVVITCLLLLSWEMLQLFHVFPIRLNPR